jgi:hypothetical protein
VGGGDGHVGVLFVGELVDCGEDGVGAVGVDEVDEGLEVASGRVVCGVVLQFAPGREEYEFRVGGAPAVLEIAGCEGQRGQLLSAPGERASVRPVTDPVLGSRAVCRGSLLPTAGPSAVDAVGTGAGSATGTCGAALGVTDGPLL